MNVSKKNPNSNKKSGGAGFIITLLILSSLSGFSFGGIIAGVLLGLGIGKITSIMGSGLDTTTHNRRDRERQAREEAVARQQAEIRSRQLAAEAEEKKKADANRIPLTGDKIADAVITTGQDMLNTIKKENAAIPDQELTEQMNNLYVKCEQIFRTVSETPSKAPQVRKFMNYYLPTTLCQTFLDEIFKKGSIDSLDHETLFTIQKFFENNLNVSETSRKLFVHRNTLVYRLEKIRRLTGLDLKEFDHAIVFKVALMVRKYLASDPTKF